MIDPHTERLMMGAAVTFNSVNSGGSITATGGFTGNVTGNLTGNVTGGTISGNGSNLTNLPAGQLTGALPAIDGSALTVGSKYYVVADGTLNTTPDSEAIDAGNAIAVNKLLVR